MSAPHVGKQILANGVHYAAAANETAADFILVALTASLRGMIAEGISNTDKHFLDEWRKTEGVEHGERVEGVHCSALESHCDLAAARPTENELVTPAIDQGAAVKGAIDEVNAIHVDALVFEGLTCDRSRWFAHADLPSLALQPAMVAAELHESTRTDTQNVKAA